MKRTRSHEIDSEGKAIFLSMLPTQWVAREESPDYGIDFVVEVFANGLSTGLRFAVQLKSTTSLTATVEAVHVRLPTDNLADYVDKERLPVFLVAVDIQSRKGFWCFLQGYIDEGRLALGWRVQKSVTIKIPLDHTLSDVDRLTTAVTAADTRMAELRSGAPEAAIRAEKNRLEGLDPRFTIQLSADANGRHVHLSAKEDVEVNITFTGPAEEMREKMTNLIDKGLSVDFEPGQVHFEGSKLFESELTDLAAMQVTQSHPAVLRLRPHHPQQRATDWLDYPGRFVGGRSESRFTSERMNVPLQMELRVTRCGDSESVVPMVSIMFDYPNWSGQSLRRLAYFEQTAELIRCAAQGHPWELECRSDGNRIFHGLMSCRETLPPRLPEFIELLASARHIAESKGVDAMFPEEFYEWNAQDIRRISSLLSGEQVQYPRVVDSMKVVVSVSEVRELVTASSSDALEGPVGFAYSSLPFRFFDQELEIGPLNVSATKMLLDPPIARLRELIKAPDCKIESLTLRASEDTRTMVSMRQHESATEAPPAA